ncbi:unnamed protein product [Cercopithifilaria johnstoni]|uniref:Uncharacterized protein n=1 Tax=Cercopithifilaria johnstoni TaxID=2874296 RepID=A0A8J2LYK5_9BILA|nr:unnamed protein product [Cercopithifilaria johnstoni]
MDFNNNYPDKAKICYLPRKPDEAIGPAAERCLCLRMGGATAGISPAKDQTVVWGGMDLCCGAESRDEVIKGVCKQGITLRWLWFVAVICGDDVKV